MQKQTMNRVLLSSSLLRLQGAVEAMLKTSMQAQLDGVRTGLSQLSTAQKDLSQIKDR